MCTFTCAVFVTNLHTTASHSDYQLCCQNQPLSLFQCHYRHCFLLLITICSIMFLTATVLYGEDDASILFSFQMSLLIPAGKLAPSTLVSVLTSLSIMLLSYVWTHIKLIQDCKSKSYHRVWKQHNCPDFDKYCDHKWQILNIVYWLHIIMLTVMVTAINIIIDISARNIQALSDEVIMC